MPQSVREEFSPRWYSVFFNPFYIIRSRLFRAIDSNKGYLKGKVLDFGCGSKPYKDIFDCEKYIGLDYETEVSSSNELLAADVFYDGKTVPFNDGEFDAAFSSEVLEHVFNPNEILPEIYRVLKPGGHLLLTCPFFWPEHEQPYDFARYSSFGLKSLMERHGFEVVHYEKTGSFFECLLQGIIFYMYCFIPHKPKLLERLFFIIFISPVMLLGLLFAKILPKKIKRNDYYLNNVIVVRKPA